MREGRRRLATAATPAGAARVGRPEHAGAVAPRRQEIMTTHIEVPMDVHLLTLLVEEFRVVSKQVRVGRETRTQRERVRDVREVACGVDADLMTRAVDTVNRIFLPAGFRFTVHSCAVERVDAPRNSEEVNEEGFFELAKRFPSHRGPSVLVVNKFQGKELGGQAVETLGVCIMRKLGALEAGKVLAHELGHLLDLDHVTKSGVDNYNLMYPGLRADDRLTEPQIKRARASKLVKKLGYLP